MRPTPVCDKIDALAASTAMSMPYAGSPSQVDSAGQPPGVALIGVNLSQCERQAGHPQGVALIGVNLRPPQATRQGWPYSRRAARVPWGAVVYRPPQATRKGWPYSIWAARAPWGAIV